MLNEVVKICEKWFLLTDCQQITFVTLNKFCPLTKTPVLNGQYQTG